MERIGRTIYRDEAGKVATLPGLNITAEANCWQKQETIKGTSMIHAANLLPWSNIRCEGGWGINTYYALNPLWYLNGFTEKVSRDLTREESVIHPLFTPFRAETERMHSTNLLVIADGAYRAELSARFLGDAIPAESFAAGANSFDRGVISGNIDFESCKENVDEWPAERIMNNIKLWHHNDFKNLAYYFVYGLFDRIVNDAVE